MNPIRDGPKERPSLVLKAQTAADLMTPNPVSLREKVTAREAAALLTDRAISAAPVINEAGAPVGVLSQTDLVIHSRERPEFAAVRRELSEDFDEFPPNGGTPPRALEDIRVEPVDDWTPVRDLMTPTVFSVRLDAPAAQVVEEMLALRVHRLFVVDDDGVLVGVISALDVLRRLGPEEADE